MTKQKKTSLPATGTDLPVARGLAPEAKGPDIRELMERLHFNPQEGRIWLEDCRMILMHAEAFGALRQELIDSIGLDTTRGLLTRVGYMAGSRDAQVSLKMKASGREIVGVGAMFRALQGIVQVELVKIEINSTSGYCYGEMIWKNSFESELHVSANGIGSEPGCWMEVGYSSGYLSTLMGKRIMVREVECRSMGHAFCRAIAKPVEEWDDPEEDLKYLQPQPAPRGHPAELEKAQRSSGSAISLKPGQERKGVAGEHYIVGASAAFNSVMHKILRVAPTNASVLLLGESGVGKSRFAREVHLNSRRRDAIFVEINCAAIPEQLIESELFGVERGAYSGATESRPGRFEIADGGTIFLDEVATLSLTAQGKLLRVLQTGEMERLGRTKTIKVDVRVVAATNENLQNAVKAGRFRSDLFYRLNVFPVTISPLRERKDDLPVLLEFYLAKFSEYHGRSLSGITPKALQAILNYTWPGNIREFQNMIERGIILAEEGEPLDIRHLFTVETSEDTNHLPAVSKPGTLFSGVELLDGTHAGGDDSSRDAEMKLPDLDEWAARIVQSGKATLSSVEDALIKAAVRQAGGNISKAATILKISRTQMDYRVKKLALREFRPDVD